ncbi:MAG: hypothetical protein U5R31_00400 [Acidimicrobiia bacterium]|nr:hypothetical protein [Acidimicrobiia bacterium]
MSDAHVPIRVVKGNEPTLLADAVGSALVDQLLVARPGPLAHGRRAGRRRLPHRRHRRRRHHPRGRHAAQTPPLLTDRRVVLVREAGLFFDRAERVGPVVGHLAGSCSHDLDRARLGEGRRPRQKPHGGPEEAAARRSPPPAGGARDRMPARRKPKDRAAFLDRALAPRQV